MYYVETIRFTGNEVDVTRIPFNDFSDADEYYWSYGETLLIGAVEKDLKHGIDIKSAIENNTTLGLVFNIRVKYRTGNVAKHSLLYLQNNTKPI